MNIMGNLLTGKDNFTPSSLPSVYDIVEKDALGNDVNFSDFRGKVIYGVNVASRCGYTKSGYELLAKLSSKAGLVLLLYPCNQFLSQEPGIWTYYVSWQK